MVRRKIGPIERALGSALQAAKTAKLDAGTVALARQYAALMDAAVPLAKYRAPLATLRRALDDLESDVGEALDKVTEALAAHSVASDLGPKLLAALTALGMTPTARKAVMGGQNVSPSAGPADPGDELRKRRDDRAERAAR